MEIPCNSDKLNAFFGDPAQGQGMNLTLGEYVREELGPRLILTGPE
jgi:hypothetical protein